MSQIEQCLLVQIEMDKSCQFHRLYYPQPKKQTTLLFCLTSSQDSSYSFYGNRSRFLVIVCLFEFQPMSSLSTTQIIYYLSIENSFKRIYSDVEPLRLCHSSFILFISHSFSLNLCVFFSFAKALTANEVERAQRNIKKHKTTERYVAGGGFEFRPLLLDLWRRWKYKQVFLFP